MSAEDYEDGKIVGRIRRDDPYYDVRYDMADAARRGKEAFCATATLIWKDGT